MADGLTINTRDGLGIASIMARKGVDTAAIGAALGSDMPTSPRAVFSGTRTVIGTGHGTWLVIDDDATPDFAETLAEQLAGIASVSDQSSGYSVVRLSGPDARTLMRRGAAIDVDPSVFGPGSAATTVIAHIGALFWQVDDQPTYDVATFRSYAGSFRHWLDLGVAAL
ncbi:sarcosine oxidase subunit gamma [Sphingomonas oryzagri]|uniref:Sarcosine oxidase subunit gamma family protein n=1 Tax=Sphingomonas oryzagri TaxID=3042314 RepID=A0ABT6N415_9SPHN|nr:sarcosine oxidase subunit gamma family protein [Sphingomonas oryzagri]MDH7639111.1 sarcosine oxidase subunit gamma family protein [Sphingomonas oryzagri]